MDGISLIQDLAIVLLTAGIAGTLCRRLGLSVIVGYLVAGTLIGPYTPPFSFISDVNRIQTLSQVGLVFLMFAIGLGLSLTKLQRMGWETLLATALGAFIMLNLTQLLGLAAGWSPTQSMFIAAMFMVSSSSVIAKIIGELNLTHERSGQVALSVTVLEDVVAIVMLTVLASMTGGGSEDAHVGQLLTGISGFVALLVGAGLLMVPRLLRKLEAKADPELQTIIVAGVLFLLAMAAAKAGYSLALGAFLLGAIVAEIPQKASVERAFAGMRDVFSSVFFVSIGMMIDIRLLGEVWLAVVGLGCFVLVARAFAISVALMVCGVRTNEAMRAGLLLGPLGEFSFIIAQLGVSAAVLKPEYYPLAVGVSIFTVLLAPLINRYADSIVGSFEKIEPRWFVRLVEAYHGWLAQIQSTPTSSIAWKLIRGRLVQIGLEMLFVTGLMIFSRQLLELLVRNSSAFKVDPQTVSYVFWGSVVILALVPIVAIWRNLSAISMILAESIGGGRRLPAHVVQRGIKGVIAVLLGYWLYFIIPIEQLGGWGWVAIGLAAVVVVAAFSRRLIYWHSHWQASMRDVLGESPQELQAMAVASARGQRTKDLRAWDVHLTDCVVPDRAAYAGQTLAQISIPARFGCAVLEIERNGHVITSIRPDLRLYPGDKLLLLGQTEQTDAACEYLKGESVASDESDEFRGSVLETFEIPVGAQTGRTLAELNLAQVTGTRVVGIQRGEQKIIAPSGQEKLEAGDNVLVTGTLNEISRFRRWLNSAPVAS